MEQIKRIIIFLVFIFISFLIYKFEIIEKLNKIIRNKKEKTEEMYAAGRGSFAVSGKSQS